MQTWVIQSQGFFSQKNGTSNAALRKIVIMKKTKILLIEDDADVRKINREYFDR